MKALGIRILALMLALGAFKNSWAMELPLAPAKKQVTEVFPMDIWRKVAVDLPGDNIFLNVLAYSFLMDDEVYVKIAKAFLNKTENFPLSKEIDIVLRSQFIWARTFEIRNKFIKAFLTATAESRIPHDSLDQHYEALKAVLGNVHGSLAEAAVANDGAAVIWAMVSEAIGGCNNPELLRSQLEFVRDHIMRANYAIKYLHQTSYRRTATGVVLAPVLDRCGSQNCSYVLSALALFVMGRQIYSLYRDGSLFVVTPRDRILKRALSLALGPIMPILLPLLRMNAHPATATFLELSQEGQKALRVGYNCLPLVCSMCLSAVMSRSPLTRSLQEAESAISYTESNEAELLQIREKLRQIKHLIQTRLFNLTTKKDGT